MKSKLITSFSICFFIGICSYSSAQNAVEEKTQEELKREKEWIKTEWPKIKEQGEKYLAEQRAKIHTLNDLECTLWIPADEIDKRNNPLYFVFLNENIVFLFNLRSGVVLYPFFTHYFIRDNKIFITEKIIGYIEGGYLFIGNEANGFIKYELDDVIGF